MSNDIQTTLTISSEEAQAGATRTLNLPGNRQLTITIPPGAYVGQVLTFPGQGLPATASEPAGSLLLTLDIRNTQDRKVSQDDASATFISGHSPEFSGNPPSQTQEALVPPPPPVVQPPVNYAYPYTSYPQPVYQAPSPEPQPYQGPAYYTAPAYPNYTTLPPQAPRRSPVGLIIVLLVIAVLVGGSVISLLVWNNHSGPGNGNLTGSPTTTTNLASPTTEATPTSSDATPTSTPNATPTPANQLPDPYGAGGTLLYQSSLVNASSDWEQSDNCVFKNDGYHVFAQTAIISGCTFTKNTALTNFVLEVQVTIQQGDIGGFFFRSAPGNQTNAYFLDFGQNGYYQLWTYKNDTYDQKLAENTTNALKQGHGQTNTIALVAQQSTLTWYINGTKIKSVTDSTYTQGALQLTASNYAQNKGTAEVVYSNLKIWQL